VSPKSPPSRTPFYDIRGFLLFFYFFSPIGPFVDRNCSRIPPRPRPPANLWILSRSFFGVPPPQLFPRALAKRSAGFFWFLFPSSLEGSAFFFLPRLLVFTKAKRAPQDMEFRVGQPRSSSPSVHGPQSLFFLTLPCPPLIPVFRSPEMYLVHRLASFFSRASCRCLLPCSLFFFSCAP